MPTSNRQKYRCTQKPATSPDLGSAAIASLGLVVAIALTLSSVLLIATALHQRAHAAGTADLAALAAATQWNYAPGVEPCQIARKVAQRNRAEMLGCTITDSSVQVVVSVAPRTALLPVVKATSRAGPARVGLAHAPPAQTHPAQLPAAHGVATA